MSLLRKFIGNQTEYRKSLHIVFVIHIIMFVVVFSCAIVSESKALFADSLDFIGDAISYGISLYVLNRGIFFRATISISKAITMISFSIPVIAYSIIGYNKGILPNAEIMTIAGTAGIIAHIVCIYYLHSFRKGDSNQLSVWICTINDLIGNVLTVIASFLVSYTGSIIPDIVSALLIVSLAMIGAVIILKQAFKEIKEYRSTHSYVRKN